MGKSRKCIQSKLLISYMIHYKIIKIKDEKKWCESREKTKVNKPKNHANWLKNKRQKGPKIDIIFFKS